MSLAFNEEQRSLKDTARDFARDNTPVEALRKLRDSQDELGYSKEHWAQMVELGFGGVIFPEAYSGFDFGVKGLAGCMEEFGRTLTVSPLLSSVALSGSLILEAGNETQKVNGCLLFLWVKSWCLSLWKKHPDITHKVPR